MKKPTNNVVPIPTRDENGKWQGSGNPTGKPKVKVLVRGGAPVPAIYRRRSKAVAEVLLDIILDETAHKRDRIAAAKEWNSRTYGAPIRPNEANEGQTHEPTNEIDIDALSPEAMDEIIRARNALKGDD